MEYLGKFKHAEGHQINNVFEKEGITYMILLGSDGTYYFDAGDKNTENGKILQNFLCIILGVETLEKSLKKFVNYFGSDDGKLHYFVGKKDKMILVKKYISNDEYEVTLESVLSFPPYKSPIFE